jgi:hypothetical protein
MTWFEQLTERIKKNPKTRPYLNRPLEFRVPMSMEEDDRDGFNGEDYADRESEAERNT